ncbi:hypothetical protein DCAR_0309943 [Daucus carota subsp. sativus]|uniref:Disease resistance protein At4g27190-like leucine-rich repeats domain-containing protein n=1 Tax=Daucus carota subsp. sativus TaxID=79200 RepID=A0AAF0WKC6_DAUCS|nr:hypothetical protein DCAR_0309943 [Daucus carota subsp. sativus]
MDLPNQKNLLKLEIIGKKGEVVFLPNTISRLYSLEKLHIRNGFQILDDVSAFPVPIQILDDVSAFAVPIVPEISKLTRLKSLQTFLEGSEHFRDTNILCKLLEFNICVGKPAEHTGNLKRSIVLHGDQPDGVESLMERAEEVVLQTTTHVDMRKFWNIDREAFADLRNLYIDKCDTMMHLASISQDQIHSGQQRTSFSELTILEIKNCSSIKYLFSNSVVTCLQRLQELCIDNCPVMEVIIDEDTGEGKIMNFEKLTSLKLVGLPKLKSFCRDKSDQFQSLFHTTVAFPSLENLHIDDLKDISEIWAKHNYDDNVSSFSKLKSLKVYDCHKLKLVIPVPMLPRLQLLEYLNIAFCRSVISEVGTFGNTEIYPLRALRSMDLESMHCLTETKLNSMDFYKAETWYPNLENLRIRDCSSLRNVFQPPCAKSLVKLKKLCVIGCDNMTEIIGAGKQEITDGVGLLPRMAELKLAHLPNLTSIWHRKVHLLPNKSYSLVSHLF